MGTSLCLSICVFGIHVHQESLPLLGRMHHTCPNLSFPIHTLAHCKNHHPTIYKLPTTPPHQTKPSWRGFSTRKTDPWWKKRAKSDAFRRSRGRCAQSFRVSFSWRWLWHYWSFAELHVQVRRTAPRPSAPLGFLLLWDRTGFPDLMSFLGGDI